ncbi:hypothetical protein OC25_02080 [Pedobacter kyungheensis]|uniref:Uncharacterized protein n=1 Tax=Pedobacter kyungheensis TaxID=1069985 RepID=A0A0C1DRT3_9SPHI|nr:ferritin-like domain-containing protein [Pedobacter kyungheensis]KIA96755.1 hypothetical protein OC25_02080 [Pedobacter kyungheensis]
MKKNQTGSSPKLAAQTSVQESPALKGLFTDSVSDLYWAENHLVKALPKMISAASSPELKKAIQSHLADTEVHVKRLGQVFGLLGEKAVAKKCDAMEGLTKEAEGIVEETPPGTATRDVGIILASQKVEHYEIASYGGLHKIALTLGLDEVAGILAQTLEEEKSAADKLGQLAEKDINYKASQEA